MEDVQQIVALARDIAILAFSLGLLLMAFVLYRRLSGLLSSAKQTVDDAEKIVTVISKRIVGPITAGAGVASGFGKVASFMFGLGKDRGNRDGKERGR